MKIEKVECTTCGHIDYPTFYHNDEICSKCGSKKVFEYKKTVEPKERIALRLRKSCLKAS